MQQPSSPEEADWERVYTQEEDLMGLFEGGKLFVDVGAHAGRWTLRLAPRFRKVLAFEPNTLARGRLTKNVREAGLGNVVVRGEALGMEEGPAILHTLDNTPSVSTLYSEFSKRRETSSEEVFVIRLDDLLLQPDLVKVDVEGAEADVLAGAKHTLEKFRSRLCVETHSEELYVTCASLLRACELEFETLTRQYPDGGKPKKYIIRT